MPVAPGKRPRLTPNPALAIKRRQCVMPFGTPGGDVQAQAMLQVFLNIAVFGMNPQQAVEAPRFATYSFPDSFEPHSYSPGALYVESRVPQAVRNGLAARGHRIVDWPDFVWRAGAVCVLRADPQTRRDLRRRRPSASMLCGWLVALGGCGRRRTDSARQSASRAVPAAARSACRQPHPGRGTSRIRARHSWCRAGIRDN